MPEVEQSLADRIRSSAESLFTGIRDIRRDIHRHPELSYEEFRTTALIEEYLRTLGLEISAPYLETGVVARLRGGRSRESSPCIALRADIDALPLEEENGHEFCSQQAGCMHACGHDMHTAMLLGTASLLAGFAEELEGDILFIFQPAEEKAPGGAAPMIEAGLLRDYRPSMIFGIHCFPHIRSGNVALRSGSLMAAADELYITVDGQGGHASAPHKASDPILAAAQIITSLQYLTSKAASPYEPAVVSVSSIAAGHATNIIPSRAVMSGTMRTMNEELRADLQERLRQVVEHTAAAFGTKGELRIVKGYPVLQNDPEAVSIARSAAEEMLGADHVEESEPVMTAEDFSWFLRDCPGAYIQLGTGKADPVKGDMLHSPTFDPDESALRIGMEVLTATAIRALARAAVS